jgi:hypothetical protein
VLVAAGAGVLTALAVGADAVGEAWFAPLGLGASMGFGLVVLLTARGRRQVQAASLVWTLPLAALAASAGMWPETGGPASVPASFAAIAGAAVLAAWCGSTPWRSRFVSRSMGGVRGGGRRAVFLGSSLASAGLGVTALATAGRGAEPAWTAAVVAGETAIAMAMFASRQWRFAPAGRARDATLLASTAVALQWCFERGLDAGFVWPAAVVAAALTVVAIVGIPAVARGDTVVEPVA